MENINFFNQKDEPDNIWVNEQDGSVIFTTAPTQSEHSVHKYKNIPEAIVDLQGIISGLIRRIPLEDQPDNYGTLVADSIDNALLRERLSGEQSIRIRLERTYSNTFVFRECDDSGAIIKPGRKMLSTVRLGREFLEHIRDFPNEDTQFLSLSINVTGPVDPDSSVNKSTDTKRSQQ